MAISPKRKTPRSQSRRTLFFDRKDKERIADHVRERFERIPFRYDMNGMAYTFKPFPKMPELKLRLFWKDKKRRRPSKINLAHAEKCLEYLGFDESFRRNYLDSLKRIDIPELDLTKDLFHEEMDFDIWFEHLTGLKHDELQRVLFIDRQDRVRWRDRLKKCGRKEITLSVDAIVDITLELFKRGGIAYKKETIDMRYREWRKVQKK